MNTIHLHMNACLWTNVLSTVNNTFKSTGFPCPPHHPPPKWTRCVHLFVSSVSHHKKHNEIKIKPVVDFWSRLCHLLARLFVSFAVRFACIVNIMVGCSGYVACDMWCVCVCVGLSAKKPALAERGGWQTVARGRAAFDVTWLVPFTSLHSRHGTVHITDTDKTTHARHVGMCAGTS